ncbi:MAG TPA: RNA-binding domain-containing protein [Thermoanaerobaculia bacterium]|jgi:ATP-dependent DNA helicase RecG
MKPSDLEILLQEGEGTTLEFKEGLSSSFARELVAMANTLGGRILLGVRDDGSVAGIHDSNDLRARIQDIARNCDPPIQVIVEPVGAVVVVTVRECAAKPAQCSDGFFWRQGATSQKLSRDEIRDFFRTEGAIRFDRSLCPKFRYPQDFDREKYRAWLRLSGISGRPRTEDVLVNIEAAERAGGRLLFRNAGVLFFARDVRHFFNQAYITCLLARGTDKVHILDRKDFAVEWSPTSRRACASSSETRAPPTGSNACNATRFLNILLPLARGGHQRGHASGLVQRGRQRFRGNLR